MDPNSSLAKSAKGIEEIETRRYKLEPRLRSLLIVVNGKMTAADLADRFGQIGDVQAMLKELARQGFVQAASAAVDDGARLNLAKVGLARAIATMLGPAGDDIAMKIESVDSLDALRGYLEARRAILDGVLGKAKAAAFWDKVASLIG